MAVLQGQEGTLVLAAGSANQITRIDRSGASIVTDAHSRYQEPTRQGSVYLASTQAGIATSVALSATQTGFTLTNPAGSGKNLVVIDALIALTTAPAAGATLVWAANVNPVATAVVQTTPLVVRNAILGAGSTAVGLAASAVTLPASPVVVRAIGGGVVATGSVTTPFIRDEIAGSIILAPGTALSLSSLTTSISAVISVTWEEITI